MTQGVDLSEFEVYCDEHGITQAETPVAFAAWLHERSERNVGLGLVTENVPTHPQKGLDDGDFVAAYRW